MAEFREYERTSTTCINAALAPVLGKYLEELEDEATTTGIPVPRILLSSGGVTTPSEARRLPVRALYSGPAAGVMAAQHLMEQLGVEDALTFDVGGTSTDVSLIRHGKAAFNRQREIAGHPVRAPMVDVHSVGAGGGSIARVDGAGFLRVGPDSAGADPGPACYGRGGTAATVTDAAVVLGLLAPDAILGGEILVQSQLAVAAIESSVAAPLSVVVSEAAQAVLTLLNESLVQAVRVMSVERGLDPRQHVLVAFGGAGPLLAGPLARELGMARIVVPDSPGLQCAAGLLTTDLRVDFGITRIVGVEPRSIPVINSAVAELAAEAEAWFASQGISVLEGQLRWSADLRFVGQSHEVEVGLAHIPLTADGIASLRREFGEVHHRLYGHSTGEEVELVTLRLVASRATESPALDSQAVDDPDCDALTGTRHIAYAGSSRLVEAKVYDRTRLGVNWRGDGPAVIEQMDSTTVVLPGQRVECDSLGNLLITEVVG